MFMSNSKQWMTLLPAMLISVAGIGCQAQTETVDDPEFAVKTAADSDAAGVVVLPPGKIAAANLQTTVVQVGTLRLTRAVPGRLQYDENRHIAIQAPTDGVIIDLPVQPGDRVEAGQVLAWLDSPDVGSARADVLLRMGELELAEQKHRWQQSLLGNVQQTIAAMREQQPFEDIRQSSVGVALGDYREKLFAAYARQLLADAMLTNVAALQESGALAGKTVRERTNELRVAEAALAAACEQAEFDARQAARLAELQWADAQRRLQISRQHLASLLLQPGMLAGASATESEPEPEEDAASAQVLSRLAIRAPFAGTIERRHFSRGERLRLSDTLFVLADTSMLWVTAQIRESDWEAISLQPGQTLRVEFPALPDRPFTARVEFVGREVSPDTNAVPLIATIDNAAGLLRPGLFMRIELPVRQVENVLLVPETAVVRHEAKPFVFVRDAADRFRRVDVGVGQTSGEEVEITHGLQPGQQVVTRGAFVLKSELLLEREE